MSSEIQKKFDHISMDYDRQRKQLIPCFNDFYGVAVSLLEPVCEKPIVLDIGAGTGLFSSFLLGKIPEARLTLVDISEKMLQAAKERFKDVSDVEYIVGDYTNCVPFREYDIIISALSIHHLSDEQKLKLYKQCYLMLKPNGIFINADQVLGNTPYTDSVFKKHWKSSVESSGLSKEEIASGYERIKLDKEATLPRQLSWLAEAGFSDVDCVYKYYHFAVMFGRKPA
ncbi:class I SAM-dependent methyltransferase [Pelotomaculum terephthalicicum JT]|uniref:class I SAM-dependent methyltransferase n=1 Tax=Pelotomaculum TaxID=191373 RepID=UPI0009D2DDE9|nr:MULTISPECIES: class I SAM-dependent methyltransferase [Pelotomaculum]MCG9969454.1 class I SAM-dependent methyltransferase [Pelotomaculum terephthalicicum JT]OPX89360.1 MAG: ubiquinone/menaquinone biosynthesis methyltransferase [Pelotomaculum sp. PtaB.Bin117]